MDPSVRKTVMQIWSGLFDLSNYLSVPFGVPGQEQWPLFVLSKWALVILPFYSVRYFNTVAGWLEHGGAGHAVPGFQRIRHFCEKFLAHAMFYIGMGIPIIGIEAVLDTTRLIGFTVTNMVIHEVLPQVFSKQRFSRLAPEWRRTLGVNLVVDNIPLEMSVFVNRLGHIVVHESPHARVHNFIKKTRFFNNGDGVCLEVVLRRFFVPKGSDPTFLVRHDPSTGPNSDNPGLGLRFEFRDLSDYAEPVYVNDQGRRRWLWRTQYWTKFFNEVGGRSYATNPFEIIRKFFLVVLGTPLAFIAGNLLVHLHYGPTVNLQLLVHFSYGIIFAFTIGGMYGASISSTLIELGAWQYSLLRRIHRSLLTRLTNPVWWRETFDVRNFSPYLDPEPFGAVLEAHNPFYRRFRFVFGGIVMGGICSWGLTYTYGASWDAFIKRNIEAAYEGSTASVAANNASVAPTRTFVRASPEYLDRGNQLYSEHFKRVASK